jgi:hypothetical protein
MPAIDAVRATLRAARTESAAHRALTSALATNIDAPLLAAADRRAQFSTAGQQSLSGAPPQRWQTAARVTQAAQNHKPHKATQAARKDQRFAADSFFQI